MSGLSEVACNTCQQRGGLTHKKVFKFSTPVVIIGWLFLIPSLMGVGCGALGLMATSTATTETASGITEQYRESLEKIDGLSASQVREIIDMEPYSEAQLPALGLSKSQARRVDSAHTTMVAGGAGAALGSGMMGGASIFMMISSFVGGLLGWLLIMRKKVIACNLCKGIHSETI